MQLVGSAASVRVQQSRLILLFTSSPSLKLPHIHIPALHFPSCHHPSFTHEFQIKHPPTSKLKSWHDLCVYTLIDEEDQKNQAVEIIDGKIVFKLK
eukprot:2054651-Rhodomonas_salina.1